MVQLSFSKKCCMPLESPAYNSSSTSAQNGPAKENHITKSQNMLGSFGPAFSRKML
jgi:hypothetical protein